MADNINVKDASAATIVAATDQLADSSQSPKVTVLDGTGSATPIDPRGGDVAHDAADAGNPNKIGTKAAATLSTATLVVAADRQNAVGDLDGALIIRADATLADFVSGTASNTDGTSTQVIAAGAAGIKHYLTDLHVGNSSGAAVVVEIKDGSTVKWTVNVPANGQVDHIFRSPIAGTAATAWNFDPASATTTVYCSAAGFKSKV